MDLTNKIAIVTGGSRDIGKAISVKLAELGAKVVVNYMNNPEAGAETVDAINATGGIAMAVKGDMTKTEDVQNLIDKTLNNFGSEIHILVNVVGGLVARKCIEEQDEDFYNYVMDINVKSVWLATKLVKPHMPKGGSIINFSSQAARDGGGPGASLYSASKGAVMTLTRAYAKEFGPLGIRVNALCPGMIATTFHDNFTKTEVREKVASSTPLRREGKACEVANLVAYLASDESSFITGSNVDINGGLAFS